jgi:hypothetical protein
MITWTDISTNIVYSKLTHTEPNPIYKEIYDFLKYWIPSIIPNTRVTINNKYSYYYDSKNKHLLIDYDNIWYVFESKYDMDYYVIKALIIEYVDNINNIEVTHISTRDIKLYLQIILKHPMLN